MITWKKKHPIPPSKGMPSNWYWFLREGEKEITIQEAWPDRAYWPKGLWWPMEIPRPTEKPK